MTFELTFLNDNITAAGTKLIADVVATHLVLETAPFDASTPNGMLTSGVEFPTQPIVQARDIGGLDDVDYDSKVTVTQNGPGIMSGDADIVASSGIAAYKDLLYYAIAD